MPKFIVVHGSVSKRKIGQSIELTQEQADHINEHGKMLRGENEKPQPRKRADSTTRIGLDNKPVKAKLQGTVIEEGADVEPVEEPEDAIESEPAEEAPPAKPEKKASTKRAPKKGG